MGRTGGKLLSTTRVGESEIPEFSREAGGAPLAALSGTVAVSPSQGPSADTA